MDLNFLQEYLVPVIVVACLVVGYLIKSRRYLQQWPMATFR